MIKDMDDAVVFTMLFCEMVNRSGDILNLVPDQVNKCHVLYNKWCSEFYSGRWEYITPDYTEIILGISKFIDENY